MKNPTKTDTYVKGYDPKIMLRVASKLFTVTILVAGGVFFYNLATLLFFGSGWFSQAKKEIPVSQSSLNGPTRVAELGSGAKSQTGSRGAIETRTVKIDTHGISHPVSNAGVSPELISKKFGIGQANSVATRELFDQLKDRLAGRATLPPEKLISMMGKLQMASGKSAEISEFALGELTTGRSRRHFRDEKDFARFLGAASGVYQNMVPDPGGVFNQVLGAVVSYKEAEVQRALISGFLERNPSRATEFLKALEQKNITYTTERGVAGD